MNHAQFRSGGFQMPPVIKNLLIINALVFMAQALLPGGVGEQITRSGALYYWGSPNFHPWQYLSYMFLHGDLTHLLLNMFSLWMFGRVLEYDLGSRRFLTFYLVTGIGAGILYSAVNWLQIHYLGGAGAMTAEAAERIFRLVNVPTVGASGAIYGILLAFGMLHPNSVIMLIFPPIPMKAKYFVLIFMVLEFVRGLQGGDGIAHFAHLTGMLAAFLLLYFWKKSGKIRY
jgi:membrane associated rhomboid family serine protease